MSTIVNIIQEVKGGKHNGEFRAFEDRDGTYSFFGFFKTKELAEDFFNNKPISKAKVASNLKRSKNKEQEWNRRSKEQVKLFSQMY